MADVQGERVAEGPAARQPRFVYLCDGRRGPEPSGRYGWRLVAANHRPLGRGRVATDSLEGCRTSARLLHQHAESLRPTLISHDGHWSWQVSLDAAPLALCVHSYARRVECLRGLTQFLAAAGLADPDDGVVRYFGPHSLRGYLIERQPREVLS